MFSYVWSRTRAIQPRSDRYPPSPSRLAIAASRAAGRGSTYQTPVPPDAVGPLVPQYPLSVRTTSAPDSAAASAAQVAAGPPPTTTTSADTAPATVDRDPAGRRVGMRVIGTSPQGQGLGAGSRHRAAPRAPSERHGHDAAERRGDAVDRHDQ